MESDAEEVNYNDLMLARNRKQLKAGGWQAIGLDHSIFKGIQKKGYRQPTPIQRKAIPLIVDGKDVVGMSRTGSGKTAAFVIPLLQKLKGREMNGSRALLVAPTREIACQTFKVVKELGRFTGLRCGLLVGGDSIEEQFSVVHQKPDIIIATPGRLLHLLIEMNLKLLTIQYVVFDEADRLFEMGFAEQLHEIIKKLPENRQTLLFSATLPKMLVDFAKAGLTDPVLVRLDVDEKISDKLSMVFVVCRSDDKMAALLNLVRMLVSKHEQTIVFCATMKHVEYVALIMQMARIDCVVLYSQLDATARKMNIEKFRTKKCSVLVVTDVAARGVDIPLLDNAINFHFPCKPKLFVHRVGRVARAGHSGKAFSLIGTDEIPYLADLFLFLGRPIRFADATSVYKEDEPLVGRFPEELIDLETDFLKSIHDNCEDLNDLRQKSENANSKYNRTRSQPSSESVRRTKTQLRAAISSASIHPFFTNGNNNTEEEQKRQHLIHQLHNFKPNTTIFEIHSGSKAHSASIMKEKRRVHQKYLLNNNGNEADITAGKSQQSDVPAAVVDNEKNAEWNDDKMENAFQEVIKSTHFSSKNIGQSTKPKRSERIRKSDELQREKEQHFIAYVPPDAQSERALAVNGDRGFGADLMANTIEMCADDVTEMHKQENRKKWDRKRKRFVAESSEHPSKKRVRTEDGTYVPATYRSGRYEKWQSKQKIGYRNEDNNSDDNDNDKASRNKQQFNNRSRGRDRNKKMPNVVVKRSELKNPDQILKQRRKKESIRAYQSHRRDENLKKKTGRNNKQRS